jgi:hypothetical protein
MGKRREPRKEIGVPVRIFGTDDAGQIFSEKVSTVNVSRHGAELTGVQARLNIDEIIGLTYGQTKGHFRVKWVGQPATAKAGHVGLLNLSAEKVLWDFPLPVAAIDAAATPQAQERRLHPRFRSVNSVEVYSQTESTPIRARTMDLSLGGCFIEMPNPLAKGQEVKIALWLKDIKVWAKGRVVSSTPGFGIGLAFTEMTDQEKTYLKQFLPTGPRL